LRIACREGEEFCSGGRGERVLGEGSEGVEEERVLWWWGAALCCCILSNGTGCGWVLAVVVLCKWRSGIVGAVWVWALVPALWKLRSSFTAPVPFTGANGSASLSFSLTVFGVASGPPVADKNANSSASGTWLAREGTVGGWCDLVCWPCLWPVFAPPLPPVCRFCFFFFSLSSASPRDSVPSLRFLTC
jgi:hypothetical protein